MNRIETSAYLKSEAFERFALATRYVLQSWRHECSRLHLGGLCGLATYFIVDHLHRIDAESPRMVEGSYVHDRGKSAHCWALVEGRTTTVVDVTLTQFNPRKFPSLYVASAARSTFLVGSTEESGRRIPPGYDIDDGQARALRRKICLIAATDPYNEWM